MKKILNEREEPFRENKTSSRGKYMRNTSDIPPKWKDIRNNAYMKELGEIAKWGVKNENI